MKNPAFLLSENQTMVCTASTVICRALFTWQLLERKGDMIMSCGKGENKMRKILSVLLALVITASVSSLPVYAEGNSRADPAESVFEGCTMSKEKKQKVHFPL